MSGVTLAAPMSGWLTSVRKVPDPVFAEEMMGPGIAIDPTEGRLVAPCDGDVLLVAPTHHSVTIRTAIGAELLIHIGLETVALGGRGFETCVQEGDRIATGDPLIRFDLDLVGLEAKSLATPIVLTNGDEFKLSLNGLDRIVAAGDPIGSIDAQALVDTSGTMAGEAEHGQAVVGFDHGLHARPAARIADCAKRFASEVTITFGDKTAKARSPVAIMALNAGHGDRVRLTAVGTDAAEAVAALTSVLSTAEAEHRRPAITISPNRRKIADNEIVGVCALPGVVIGTARHWRRRSADAPEQGSGVSTERSALGMARAAVRERLKSVSDGRAGPASEIACAHVGLLDDEDLNAAALEEIDRGRSAARAWQIASQSAAESLRSSGNPLLRERISDLDDISRQVTSELLGEAGQAEVEIGESTILLADELLPSEILSLPRDRIIGLATSGGGATSHMAIIAASFGIPTLVAMGPGLMRVPDGVPVLLDAAAGSLMIDPDEQAKARAIASPDLSMPAGECITRDGQQVRLLANLGGIGEVNAALAAGAEGCGLLRTEFLFLDRPQSPSADEQRATYQAIADALCGRSLTIRTLDIGGDKPVAYITFPPEQNPALGARGIRTDLFDPDLIEEQLRAIGSVTGEAIKVMVPMISSVDELRSVRERLNAIHPDITLGVMVETPAAALIADRLAAEADFLSIGSNDLAQYTLAMDRTNPLLAPSIDALHPAVLRLIAMTAEAAHAAGKSVSLCGSLASEPIGALVLVGLGIYELSGVPAALPAIRHALAQVSATDCRDLARRALTLERAAEVRALAAELLVAAGDPR